MVKSIKRLRERERKVQKVNRLQENGKIICKKLAILPVNGFSLRPKEEKRNKNRNNPSHYFPLCTFVRSMGRSIVC